MNEDWMLSRWSDRVEPYSRLILAEYRQSERLKIVDFGRSKFELSEKLAGCWDFERILDFGKFELSEKVAGC